MTASAVGVLGRLYDRYLYAPIWNRFVWEPAILDRPDPEWADARTLDDLGELTARWLEGRIRRQPGYGGPVDVDEDFAPGITAALIACNRAGFVTFQSQGGSAEHDMEAAVIGLASPELVEHLMEVVPEPFCGDVYRRPAVDGDDVQRLWAGAGGRGFPPETADDIEAQTYRGCHPDAVAAAVSAWQVSIWDPRVGCNDLWPALLLAATPLTPTTIEEADR